MNNQSNDDKRVLLFHVDLAWKKVCKSELLSRKYHLVHCHTEWDILKIHISFRSFVLEDLIYFLNYVELKYSIIMI